MISAGQPMEPWCTVGFLYHMADGSRSVHRLSVRPSRYLNERTHHETFSTTSYGHHPSFLDLTDGTKF